MAKFTEGITRNPYHVQVKNLFAVNMDKLKVKVDGEEIPIRDVQGAFPGVETVLVFKKKKDDFVIGKDGHPETEAKHGKVEIIGTPESCGCSAKSLQVPNWWTKSHAVIE